MKIIKRISKTCTQTLLDNGFWLHEEKLDDGKTTRFTFVKYWHPCEIKHMMRDFASNSDSSYIRLGQKLKSLGLCIEGDEKSWDLKNILIAIADNISMNAKPWRRGIENVDKTVKEYYGDREGYKKYLLKTFKEELV